MKKNLITLFFLAVAMTGGMPAVAQHSTPALNEKVVTFDVPQLPKDAGSFLIANDLGRNGYYEQKPVAELMGNLAEKVDIECVAALGDVHHFEGVASTSDPLWMTNYELVYSHPELMLPWYPVLGNHEYNGNTQAVIDYSRVSRRWMMPSRYYAKTVEAEDDTQALLLFIDTAPLIDKYRKDSIDYPDACRQDREAQLAWIEEQLRTSKAKWKIVMGHHPVYAQTTKSDKERADMQKYLKPLLDRYGVDLYVCGHIHTFQHIVPAGSKTEYLVNTSGSLARAVSPIEGTRFCSGDEGFTLLSFNTDEIHCYLYNEKGKIIYDFSHRR